MKSGRRLKEANVLFLIDVTKCNKDILQSIFLGVEDIAFSLKITNNNYHFSYSSICYSDAGQPLISDFKDDIDEFVDYLNAKFDSINDLPGEPITTPINYANLLMTCRTNLCEREGRKVIVWITSRPALGERFCGEVGNSKEEEQLVYIIQELFNEVLFHCIYLNERAKKMFEEMKPIHQAKSDRKFVIESLSEIRDGINRFNEVEDLRYWLID